MEGEIISLDKNIWISSTRKNNRNEYQKEMVVYPRESKAGG